MIVGIDADKITARTHLKGRDSQSRPFVFDSSPLFLVFSSPHFKSLAVSAWQISEDPIWQAGEDLDRRNEQLLASISTYHCPHPGTRASKSEGILITPN